MYVCMQCMCMPFPGSWILIIPNYRSDWSQTGCSFFSGHCCGGGIVYQMYTLIQGRGFNVNQSVSSKLTMVILGDS